MAAAVLQSVNLYQPVAVGWRTGFDLVTMGRALLLVLAGAALLAGYALLRERQYERTVAAVVSGNQVRTAQLADIGRVLEGNGSLSDMQERVAALEQRTARLNLVLQKLPDLHAGQGIPFSQTVAGVANAAIGGVWISNISVLGMGGRLTLRGTATRPELLPAYLQALGRQAALHGRGIAGMVAEVVTDAQHGADGAVNFSISQQEELPESDSAGP